MQSVEIILEGNTHTFNFYCESFRGEDGWHACFFQNTAIALFPDLGATFFIIGKMSPTKPIKWVYNAATLRAGVIKEKISQALTERFSRSNPVVHSNE